jgi:hypothetical protein
MKSTGQDASVHYKTASSPFSFQGSASSQAQIQFVQAFTEDTSEYPSGAILTCIVLPFIFIVFYYIMTLEPLLGNDREISNYTITVFK